MKYELSDDTWDNAEIDAINKIIDSRMFTMGKKVAAFEKAFAQKMDVKYAVMSNSGSSANLLAIAALVYSKRLKAGDEVIVTAVSWSTTYAPLQQFGLKVKFVDIDKDTLNIEISQLAQAISSKTKLIFLVNLLGNPNEFDQIKKIAKDIMIIEDNCESMGATYNDKQAGTIGLIGTFSTFYSHHICTMEGGVSVTNDEDLYHHMLSIRAHGWTRNLPNECSIYKKREDAFYESFNFIMPGYNLRPLELEGAIGIEQLKKLDNIIVQRRKNAEYFKKCAKDLKNIRIQKEIEKSSWFGFAIVLEGDLIGKRTQIVSALVVADIAVRPIVAGNFTRNKAVEFMNYEVFGKLNAANDIHDNGFFVGNHSKDNKLNIDLLFETLQNAIKEIDG